MPMAFAPRLVKPIWACSRWAPITRRLWPLLAIAGGWAQALPDVRIPLDRNEVVLAQPLSARRGDQQIIEQLRRDARSQTLDCAQAVLLAESLVREARRAGDPRYLGQAEAALRTWWSETAVPTRLLVLRAGLKQARHDFAGARHDLQLGLQQDPHDPQAWLTQGSVQLVQADYAGAASSLLTAYRLGAGLPAQTAIAILASMKGRSEQAQAQLKDAIAAAGTASPVEERAWALTILGEIEYRSGHLHEAIPHLRAALTLNPNESYLLGALSEALLDAQKPAEAMAIVADQTANTGLLLRLALAEQAMVSQRLAAPNLKAHIAELGRRFDLAASTRDEQHLREEARFRLSFDRAPAAALDLALKNWRIQREPADARILLESALAAKNPRAAQPVIDWMEANRIEDPQLRDLRAELLPPRTSTPP